MKSPVLNPKIIGAEIWVEPGHTEAQVDRWFRLLAENEMRCARVLLVWQYLEVAPHKYDFTLYDWCFRAAEKYGIKIVASLQTDSMPAHWGMPYNLHARYLPQDENELRIITDYIKAVVGHFKDSPAVDCWLHLDETCVQPSDTPLAMARFRDWLRAKYGTVEKLNATWRTYFTDISTIEYDPRWTGAGIHSSIWVRSLPLMDFYEFYRGHITWFLRWVTDEVKAVDPVHPIHNYVADMPQNHAARSLDIPSWRDFLDTLGCGVHPPWHLSYLAPDQVGLGVALSCEITRGAIEPKRFWLSETQGGSIILAGHSYPRNQTPDDMGQVFWTALGSGADRVIYWSLNHRLQDYEAGEWGMLDLQDQPSERFDLVRDCAATVNRHADLFAASAPWATPVTVMLSLETQTLQQKFKNEDQPGRGSMAHLHEAYSIFQALQEAGIPARIKFMHDYDWTVSAATPQVVILPHVTALTVPQSTAIDAFVAAGHTLIATGLTGLYDEWVNFHPLHGSPLRAVLGGRLRDVRLVSRVVPLELQKPALTVPSHLWISEILPDASTPIGTQSGWITATHHRHGKGQSYWLPAPIGLGARVSENYLPLADLLRSLLAEHLGAQPVRFAGHVSHVYQRILEVPGGYITVHANTADTPRTVKLETSPGLAASPLWASPGSKLAADGTLTLPIRGTLVSRFEKH